MAKLIRKDLLYTFCNYITLARAHPRSFPIECKIGVRQTTESSLYRKSKRDAIWKGGGRKAATLTQTSAPRASKGTSALCLPHSYCTPLGTSRMLFNYFSCEGH